MRGGNEVSEAMFWYKCTKHGVLPMSQSHDAAIASFLHTQLVHLYMLTYLNLRFTPESCHLQCQGGPSQTKKDVTHR